MTGSSECAFAMRSKSASWGSTAIVWPFCRSNIVAGRQCGESATIAHMTTFSSRDLRNHTAEVLRQVSGGTRVTITVNGNPVAEIGPVRTARPQFLSKADLIGLIAERQADHGLSTDLEMLAGDTTDDLDVL
jgi:prevent-host-death family protein